MVQSSRPHERVKGNAPSRRGTHGSSYAGLPQLTCEAKRWRSVEIQGIFQSSKMRRSHCSLPDKITIILEYASRTMSILPRHLRWYLVRKGRGRDVLRVELDLSINLV